MRNLQYKVTLLLSLFISIYSYAWGLTGHRVIAEIADHHLSGRAKRQIKKILGNEKMAYWANWADFIKSDTTALWKETPRWHYVNVPPQQNFSEFQNALKAQQGPNLYTQIKVLSLKLKDKKLPLQERKTALIFLIHLMGDLAQPLHLGRLEDLGGNRINVTYFGQKTNLHSVWDSKLIDSQKYSYTEYAQVLDPKSKQEIKSIQSGNLEQWFYESHVAANRIYQHVPSNGKLSYAYQYEFNATLERQLLTGGLRLACLLNEIFK